MTTLDEFNLSVQNSVFLANKLGNDVEEEIRRGAPLLIHQRFCYELVRVMKANPGKPAKDVPKAMEILKAIDILEEYFPELKTQDVQP